jgi:hypothetical protein
MKQFAAGVVTTVTAGLLLAWVVDSVPTAGSARAALDAAMQASADVAQLASSVALVLACLCGLGALAYWIWRTVGPGARSIEFFGLGGPATGAAVTFGLAYAGLSSWADATSAALPLLLGAAAVGAWTASVLRRRWSAFFRIA